MMYWVVRPNDTPNCKLYVSVENTSDLWGYRIGDAQACSKFSDFPRQNRHCLRTSRATPDAGPGLFLRGRGAAVFLFLHPPGPPPLTPISAIRHRAYFYRGEECVYRSSDYPPNNCAFRMSVSQGLDRQYVCRQRLTQNPEEQPTST
jgi:hypothetical protein